MGKCRRCSKTEHKQADCKVTQCSFCILFDHDGNRCFKRFPHLKQKVNTSTVGFSNFSEEFSFSCLEWNFVVDSGASPHMFSDRSLFTDFSDKVERCVKNANDSFSKVEGIGNVRVCLLDAGEKEHFKTFSNCLFLSDHAQNLISVSKLSQKG